MNKEMIPGELKVLRQWCVWKKDKLPWKPGGGMCSTTNPITWDTYLNCETEFVLDHSGEILGCGFIFSETDQYVGIDLDNVLDEEGYLTPFVEEVLDKFNGAYMEISPSGNGIHIICKGEKPGERCRSKFGKTGVEMYEKARYFTMTGDVEPDWEVERIGGCQAGLKWLYEKMSPQELVGSSPDEKKGDIKTPQQETPTLAVKDIITIIKHSAQAEKFARLTTGSFEDAVKEYDKDHSRAVYALTGLLSFYTGDFEIIDQVFKASPLYCGRWAPDSSAVGKNATGKWARLGEPNFIKQRTQAGSRGDIYTGGTGKTSPEEAFDLEERAAEFERHIELPYDNYPDVRRDLLTRSLYVRQGVHTGWEPVGQRSVLAGLRGECLVKGKAYKKSRMEDYLYRFERSLKPQLLIDVPDWDGEDRIAFMCARLRPADISVRVFTDLFKDWCAKFWEKILEPEKIQNRCIVLSGRQGIGKDIWVKSLFCSLENYISDLTLCGSHTKETDIACVMGSSLLMFISEFDKTREIGVETLKELITKESFSFVRKYDRDPTRLINRCSVIGACNPETVLRDFTGNRRFLLIKLSGEPGEAINWKYPVLNREYSLQVIAQCKALAYTKYRADIKSETEIARHIEAYTPDDPNTDIVEDFESDLIEKITREGRDLSHLYKVSEISDILSTIARNHGLPRKTILSVLKAAGCQYRHYIQGRHYGTRVAAKKGAEHFRPAPGNLPGWNGPEDTAFN
jgi:hypothetical protein